MQDRPTKVELLRGVEHVLREVLMPALAGADRFRARVAANVVGTVVRELETGADALRAEHASLRELLHAEGPPPETLGALERAVLDLNEALAKRIRAGDADGGDFRARVLAHLRTTTVRKLDITNPTLGQAIRRDYAADREPPVAPA